MDGRRSAVLLDEHPIWLDAVERIVDATGIAVVAKTTDVKTALAVVEEHEPDLLVTEILFARELDGIEFVRRARELVPHVKPIVLSTRNDMETIRAALAAGAVAYVVKTTRRDDLASVVRQAFDPSVYLPGGFALQASPPLDNRLNKLTPREREILAFVAEGNSNAEVARRLWVTEQTVKVHLSSIYRKLRVANRTEASRFAQLSGLLPAPARRANARETE